MKKDIKKIVYIANARIPTEKAHGYQISKMCEQFSDFGYEVELWLPQRKNKNGEDIFCFYNIKPNFKIKKVFCLDFFHLERFLGPVSFFIECISFYFFAFVRSIFLSRKIIIYTRQPIICLLRILFFQVVYESHSISKREKSFFLITSLASKVVTVSSGLKDIFLKRDFKVEKIFVSSDAVDLEVFDIDIGQKDARNNLGLPEDKYIIVYTGKFKTMGMDKGISDILKSLQFLSSNIVFLAVGGSLDDINFYKKEAEELQVLARVIFVEHVSQSELAIYQKGADILLMPFPYNKHYAYYMSPLKMFEYMSGKRPIIASNLPAIREVLNEENSFLCQPNNPKDLSDKVTFVFNNKRLVENVIDRAYQIVKSNTWKKRTEEILFFIEN